MFNFRLAGDHLYGKWLFTWLSLELFLMVSYFVLSFSHKMAWVRSGTEFRQFQRTLLPTLCVSNQKNFYQICFHNPRDYLIFAT